MVAFVLKNNYFEFNGEIKHQISGTTIVKKFASTYASIFIHKIETNFLDAQKLKPFSMMFSLLGHMVKKNGKSFQKILMTNTPTLNLPMNSIEKAFPFWTKR